MCIIASDRLRASHEEVWQPYADCSQGKLAQYWRYHLSRLLQVGQCGQDATPYPVSLCNSSSVISGVSIVPAIVVGYENLVRLVFALFAYAYAPYLLGVLVQSCRIAS